MALRFKFKINGALLLPLLMTTMGAGAGLAQEPRTFRAKGSYDDVRFELNNAIVARGLNPGATGNISEMLERTGAAVGSTTKVYKAAILISQFTYDQLADSARYDIRAVDTVAIKGKSQPVPIYQVHGLAAAGP